MDASLDAEAGLRRAHLLAEAFCESVGGARVGTCYSASWQIRDVLGWPIVGGVRDGVTHYWNATPDGRWFDSTAAQFDDDGPQVVERSDARYEQRADLTP